MSQRPLRADAKRNRAAILTAAEEVFADGGPDASTEEVARRAGVAIGTVFRHFPTKGDLLRALLKRLLDQLTGTRHDDLFAFFDDLVARTAANRTVVALLAAEGTPVSLAGSLTALTGTVDELLRRGQDTGRIRAGIRTDEVMALLLAACQGALQGGWDDDLRARTLDVIFAGLREIH